MLWGRGVLMPSINLSQKQSERLAEWMQAFYVAAMERNLPRPMMFQIYLIRESICEHGNVSQEDIDAITTFLDVYFSTFTDEDIDPYLEQAYCKLAGHWPEHFEPWYDRERSMRHEPKLGY